MTHEIDEAFTSLPLRELADAALSRARELGAEHADFRVERIRTGALSLHDAKLETSHDDDERGLCVRVVHDGTWGFAASADLSADGARKLAEQAVDIAQASRAVNAETVELAPEPS
jgi:TldD protein